MANIKRWNRIIAAGTTLMLSTGTLFAAVDKQAYDEAMAVYNAKEYQKAYGEFKKLFFEDMSDPKVNFYLGRSAYESGQYNDAVAAYERVLISEPAHMKARVELARTYFVMRLYEQAEIEFTAVLLHPIPEGVRKTINEYMKKIEDAKEKHMLNAMLNVMAQDDSNINNGNSYLANLSGGDAVSDRAVAAYLALIHTYKLSERDTFWITNANVYTQRYSEYGEYDVTFPFVETGWQMKKKNYSVSVLGGFESLTYGHEATFNGKSLAFVYDRQLTQNEVINAKLKATDREYVKAAHAGRDSLTTELSGKWQKLQASGAVYTATGSISVEKEKEDLRTDVNNNTYKLGFNYYDKLGKKTAYSAYYNFNARQNHDTTTVAVLGVDSKRSDTSHTIGASFINELDKRSYLTFYINHTKNESNQDLFDYDKTLAGVSYSINFDNDWLRNHPDWEEK